MGNNYDHVLYWLRVEIPAYLDKLGNADAFIERYNMDCASYYWYQTAVEVAILRWPDAKRRLKKLRRSA